MRRRKGKKYKKYNKRKGRRIKDYGASRGGIRL